MNRFRLLLVAVITLPLALGALAQNGDTGTTAWRCGNSYSTQPCPGGTAVDVGDSRSDAQRRQAEAVKVQDTRLAQNLAAERQTRERTTVVQRPAALGPTAAERAQMQAIADRQNAVQSDKANKAKKNKKPKRNTST